MIIPPAVWCKNGDLLFLIVPLFSLVYWTEYELAGAEFIFSSGRRGEFTIVSLTFSGDIIVSGKISERRVRLNSARARISYRFLNNIHRIDVYVTDIDIIRTGSLRKQLKISKKSIGIRHIHIHIIRRAAYAHMNLFDL